MSAAGESPAEVMRRAAKLIRERAEAATPGRWGHMCLGSEGCLVLRKDGAVRERGRGRVARFGQKDWHADHADAEFVASMHPLVGAALADLLDRIAWTVEIDAGLLARVGSDETLAIARAYLGTEGGS